MKEEKMMILSMLEEGKITSEEAVKLLEALEDGEIYFSKDDFTDADDNESDKAGKFSWPQGKKLEEIGSDISSALSNMFSGLKDIGSSIGLRSNYETITLDLEKDISHIESPIIDLKSINGNIQVCPSNNDKLLIKVTCQYKPGLFNENDGFYNFYEGGNKIVFAPTYNTGISIKLDVYLPSKNYDEIILTSTNGKIQIDKIGLNKLKCITSNGGINLSYVSAKEINLTTKNSRIKCEYTNSDILNAVTTNSNIVLEHINGSDIKAYTTNSKISIDSIVAKDILCKTSNSSIEVSEISCETINLTTSNGKITCDKVLMDKLKDIKFITSNGPINWEINDILNSVYFDLETSMGNISLEIPNLVYKINKQANLGLKKIIAHSVNYEEVNNGLKVIASTSNGSIKIY